MGNVKLAVTEEEISACYPVMALLRPHVCAEAFLPAVRRMGEQGYRLAYLAAEERVQAVAGFRIIEMLRTGPMLEVDDLVTLDDGRSKGYGGELLRWCYQYARERGCSVVELDSAVTRASAHRFYFRERMHVLAFHFSHTLYAHGQPARDPADADHAVRTSTSSAHSGN